jgi:adenylyltransferase/sulfurtransferase
MNRYSRHITLSEIGQTGQDRLLQSKVLVVGAGGLGCPVLQYLTAAGIGTIGIIDFDTVEESNLQRQILFGTSSLGRNKAIAAKTRLEDLNPTINIKAYPEQLTPNNAESLFDLYDIIVDGTDNFSTRYLINDAAVISDKPVVYGAIYKFEGQVSVFNYRNGPTYRCLFPHPPKEGTVPNCSEIGVLGVLPGIIGSMQANEVIKIALDFGDVLSGKLLFYNSRTSDTSILKIPRSISEVEKVRAKKGNLKESYPYQNCSSTSEEISTETMLKMDNIQFIDVREIHEQPHVELQNCLKIPLGQLETNLNRINSKTNNIIFCQTGIRSKTAVQILRQHNFKNCYSLKSGVSAIVEHFN